MLLSLNHVLLAWFDPLIHETRFYWSIVLYGKTMIENQPRAPAMYVNVLPREDISIWQFLFGMVCCEVVDVRQTPRYSIFFWGCKKAQGRKGS